MKKLIVIAALLITSIQLMSQKPQVTFFSEDGVKFWVIMDGVKQNDQAHYNVQDIVMDKDWAKVKIIFEDPDIEPVDKTITGVDPDGNPSAVTYVIKKTNRDKWVVRASSWKKLEAAQEEKTKPVSGSTETAAEKPSTQTRTTITETTTTTAHPPKGESAGVSVRAGETGVDMKVNVQSGENTENTNFNMEVQGWEQTQTTTTTTKTTTVTNETESTPPPPPAKPENRLPGYNGPVGCENYMSDDQFGSVSNSIESKSFEDTKLTLAKQVASSNCLLVSQVKEIMGLFSFEDTKLEFAKYAYDFTHDRGNYYQVNDVFDFDSSVEELTEYIQNK